MMMSGSGSEIKVTFHVVTQGFETRGSTSIEWDSFSDGSRRHTQPNQDDDVGPHKLLLLILLSRSYRSFSLE